METTAASSRIETLDQLRALYREPSKLTLGKFLAELDEHCEAMIRHSSFVCLATSAADGSLDISPRGDPPGSVKVLDSKTLLMPDRTGNNKLDTLTNLTGNSEIAMIFMVPGIIETLRVSGRAQLIHNDPRLDACAINGRVPVSGILVDVRRACLQCGKSIIRSALWEDTYHVNRKELASFGKMLVDQTCSSMTAEQLDQAIQESYDQRLY